MHNCCVFSPCRTYRYVLTHEWDELLPRKPIVWIGLNPSTADEQQLDPTLRRIKAFSQRMGFNVFHMLNLFAFRATYPADMKRSEDPVGPENDAWIKKTCEHTDTVVACWGTLGSHLGRDGQVRELLKHKLLYCLWMNADGQPSHPLYLHSDSVLMPF